ncbi:MAG: YgiQ family radical SAM protein, partial [Clostridia bacterium]|nr:YgiQ family radical SAM protein [Clostridia bacterium]
MTDFLPVSKGDMEKRGLSSLDFIIVTGDAYVDHPSFGTAIISRVLESKGYTVGIIAQPDWTSTADFTRLGRPNLGFLVNSGNLDSMVAHYTVAKKLRSADSYSPGGVMGKRPDRAVIVYCNRIREAYKDIPLIIGGLEASLRRFAHYDYWSDSVRRSILVDSGADLVIYGMGERQVVQIAKLLSRNIPIASIDKIAGTCVLRNERPQEDAVSCPSFELVKKDKKEYAAACKIQYDEHDPIRGKTVIQPHSLKFLVCYPPAMPLSTEELDEVYGLPYQRAYHPMYEKEGGIPAIKEVEFSIVSSRGCFGGCNFCSLAFHQGRMVTSRSHKSIIKEAEEFTKNPEFKGYISDVGGPTANFRIPSCKKQLKEGMCKDRACLT